MKKSAWLRIVPLFIVLALTVAISGPAMASDGQETVRTITIFGARLVPPATILQHLGVQEGDLFSRFKLELGVTWLRHSGMFSSVDYDATVSEGGVEINLYVNENIGMSRTGGNSVFGTVDREERYGWFDIGLPLPTKAFGLGFSTNLGLNISEQSFMIAPTFEGSTVFGKPLGWRIEAKYISKDTDELSSEPERVVGGEIGFKQALLPNVSWMANLGYEYEYKVTSATDDHYLALSDRLLFDIDPLLVFVETETGYSMGDTDNGWYFKAGGKVEMPVFFTDYLFVIPELQAGWASANTPRRALYDVGNASGLRGFELQEADAFWVGSATLYWELLEGLQVYTFGDVGSLRYQAAAWDSVLYDFGIGFRWSLMGAYGSYNSQGQLGWGLSFETYF